MSIIRLTRIAGCFATAAALAILARGAVLAQETNVTVVGPDVFETGYFDVGTSAAASRAGFGGSSSSGGAGDNTLRISNPTFGNGILCAMIYVFDDFASMQACCGCPVTPNGLRTLSVIDNLTSNFAVNGADLNAGVIEIVSSRANFTPGNPPPGPIPPATNTVCSPTGSASNDVFGRAAAITPASGLRAWITHDELAQPLIGSLGGRVAQGVSVDELEDSPLEAAHVTALEGLCEALIANGGGVGACSCGAGQDTVPSNSSHSR